MKGKGFARRVTEDTLARFKRFLGSRDEPQKARSHQEVRDTGDQQDDGEAIFSGDPIQVRRPGKRVAPPAREEERESGDEWESGGLADPDSANAASPSGDGQTEWELVWRSNKLSERDLNVPTGETTHRTGSMGLGRGTWDEMEDHRHYFRDEVFAGLDWTRDPSRPHLERAEATFEVWTGATLQGEAVLRVTHNTDTTSKTYKQNNHMTSLSWGDAKDWVSRSELLSQTLYLEKERDPSDEPPRFRIKIEQN